MAFGLPDETAPGGIPRDLTPGLLDRVLAALSEGMQRAARRPLPGDLPPGAPWSSPSMVPPETPTIGPTMPQPALQAISDAVGRIKGVAQATATSLDPATQSPYDVGLAQVLPFLTEMLAGNKQDMFRDLATQMPITQGRGETLGIKPEYAGDVLDILGGAAGGLGVARTMASSMPRVGRAAEEGILRWGGDPTLMYSHGLSKGLKDPQGDPLKFLIDPSLAITGGSRHRNPFGQDYGILVPKGNLGEEYSRIGNRDLYIGRPDDSPGGFNPSAEEFIAKMGLVPPPKTEGSSFYNWAERNPHTGQWQVKKEQDLSLPTPNEPHRAAIFSSPEFQNFKDFEERAGGASVLGADYSSIENWSNEADRLFRSWYENKFGHKPTYSTDWLKTLREAAKDTRRTRGDDEAKSLLELFKTAPSEYGELKVGGRIPITGEHWAGAILKPDTYSRFESLLQNRGIPTTLSPTGDNKYGLIHDIASQMQMDAGPLKSSTMKPGRGWTPEANKEATVGGGYPTGDVTPPKFKLESKAGASALGSPTFFDIAKAANMAMEHPDFDGYTAVFNHKGKTYKVDAETGSVFKAGETGLPLFNIADIHPATGEHFPTGGGTNFGAIAHGHTGKVLKNDFTLAASNNWSAYADNEFNYHGTSHTVKADGTILGQGGAKLGTLQIPEKKLPAVPLGDHVAYMIGETGQSPHFYAHEQWAKHSGEHPFNSDFYPHVFTDDGDSYMLHSTGNVYALDAKGEKIKQGAAHPEPVFNVKPDHPKYSAPTETPIPQPAVGTAAHQAKLAILANQKPAVGGGSLAGDLTGWLDPTGLPHGVLSKDVISDAKGAHETLMKHDKKEHFNDDDSLTFMEADGVRYHVAKNGDIFADDNKIGSIHNPQPALAGGSTDMMKDYTAGLIEPQKMFDHLFPKPNMSAEEYKVYSALYKDPKINKHGKSEDPGNSYDKAYDAFETTDWSSGKKETIFIHDGQKYKVDSHGGLWYIEQGGWEPGGNIFQSQKELEAAKVKGSKK